MILFTIHILLVLHLHVSFVLLLFNEPLSLISLLDCLVYVLSRFSWIPLILFCKVEFVFACFLFVV